MGKPRLRSSLEELSGVRVRGRLEGTDNWMRFPKTGDSSAGKPDDGATLREGIPADWPLSARQVVGPAILINRVGRGMVLTFAGSPDFATASEHHIVEARRVFANAVRFLHPRPRVRVEAPAHVESVVTDDPAGRTLRVHLLAYGPTPQTTPAKDRPYVLPGLIEDTPLFRAAVTLNLPIRKATAWSASTVLKRQGHRLEATVEGVHEILVLRY